jgi:hypothetical protein
MDLVHETTPPLAWDHEQMPFQPPPEAIAWKVRRYTGKPGRPPAVYGDHGIVHLGMEAKVDDLRRAVRNEPGSYRLYPVDVQGNELSPVACMELVPTEPAELARLEPAETDSAATSAVVREVLDLCKHLVKSRDEHDAMLSRVLSTLVTTTATIQRSTAMLLGAANTTIQVANGVESLERQEPPEKLDVDELSRQLAEALTPEDEEDEESSSQPPWFVQMLNGPVGVTLFQFLNGFLGAIAAKHAQSAAASGPAPRPPGAAPAPAPRPAAPPTEPRRNAGAATPTPAQPRSSAAPSPTAERASPAPDKRAQARPGPEPEPDDPDSSG